MAIKVGTDPEVFVIKNGQIVHCIGKLGGSKAEPRKTKSGAIQEDNVLFEFNTPACDTAQQFSQAIQNVLMEGLDVLGAGYEIANVASHIYTPEELQGFPEEAFVFGCDPDFNGLDLSPNPAPAAANPGLRSAGGHIHFGFDHLQAVDQQTQQAVIVAADYLMGLQSVLMDTDTRRKELYGKAGACRMKPYGCEYRTLSNFWIFQEETRHWAFNQAQKVFDVVKSGAIYEMAAMITPEQIQHIINTNNQRQAEMFIKQLEAVA